jgi:TM2 domain-containing membrane protein YozV
MPHITHYMPELPESESEQLQSLLGRMPHQQIEVFVSAYRQRRKDPHTVLITAIVGLVAIPGLQRFWLGQIGLGFLYLLTWGLVFFGSISDLVRYKTLAYAYNQKAAQEIVANITAKRLEGDVLAPISAGFSKPEHCNQ